MDKIFEFASNNYIMLIIVSVFLLFALVGFIVSAKNKKESPFKIAADNNKEQELNLEGLNVENNVSLQDAVYNKATVKPEEETLD